MEKILTIGQISKQTGLSRKTIRYYEKEKLIPEPNRSITDYRLYQPKVIERLQFIQKAKEIGFSLGEIRGILELSEKGKPCCEQVFSWTENKLAKIDEQILFLQELKKKITRYRQKWKKNTAQPVMPESEICKLIESVELSEE